MSGKDDTRGWSQATVKQFAQVIRGVSYDKREARENPGTGLIPILRATNIQESGLVLDQDLVYVPEKCVSDEQMLRPGDIVVATSSGSKHLVGKTAQLKSEWKGSFGAFCATIRPDCGIDSRYLGHFFGSPAYKAHISSKALGVNINNLRRGDLEELEIPIAPKDQQELIVAEIEKQFSRLDEAVASLKRAKANLKRYKAAVLNSAVEGCLVPTEAELSRQAGRSYETAVQLLKANEQRSSPKPTKRRAGRLWGAGHVPQLTTDELSKLPEGWTWAKVRQVGSDPEDAVQVGPMSMRSDDFIEAGVPVLNVGCVQWGRFDETKLNFLPEKIARDFSRYRIQPGDVLFTRSGTVGRCAVAKSHQRNWLMTFHLLRARPNPNCCLPEYLRTVFEGAAHIRRQTKEASIGTTRAGFNTNLLANLDVPLPPKAEQQRIVAEVERRLSVIDELEATVEANLTRAERLRHSILSDAFSGKLAALPETSSHLVLNDVF